MLGKDYLKNLYLKKQEKNKLVGVKSKFDLKNKKEDNKIRYFYFKNK